MRDHDPLKWWHELALIVVSQNATPLPDELILDSLAEVRLHRRNENESAGLMHGCVYGIPVPAVISPIESFGGLSDPQRAPTPVGLYVHTSLMWEGCPCVRQLRELRPPQFDSIPHTS